MGLQIKDAGLVGTDIPNPFHFGLALTEMCFTIYVLKVIPGIWQIYNQQAVCEVVMPYMPDVTAVY